MATDKPRFSISMDEKTYEKVIAYKEEKGIATQSKAVIKIMEMGLRDLEREAAQKKSPSTAEAAPGEDHITMEESNRLLDALGLTREGQDLSDADLAFLEHIVGLLDAWFSERE